MPIYLSLLTFLKIVYGAIEAERPLQNRVKIANVSVYRKESSEFEKMSFGNNGLTS